MHCHNMVHEDRAMDEPLQYRDNQTVAGPDQKKKRLVYESKERLSSLGAATASGPRSGRSGWEG
jgi:hypothetical protein